MIDAKELRQGNWIEYSGNGEFRKVEGILKDCIVLWDERIEFKYISAIPLTPEILEKCGFKKWGRDDYPRTITYEIENKIHIFPSNYFCDFKGYGYIHYKLSDEINNENKGITESARFKFQHLHQLQNLFFALTGNELNYK